MHIGIAQCGQTARGQGRHALAVVIHHEPDIFARRQALHVQLKPAVGKRDAVKQMGLTILAVLAHIEQGNLLAVVQPGFQRGRLYKTCHEVLGGGVRGGRAHQRRV